jgi:hypothetical protein
MAGLATASTVRDTEIGPDMATGRGTGIAQPMPIGAVPSGAIAEAAFTATVRARSTVVADFTVVVDSTVEGASMAVVGPTAAGTGNSSNLA